MRTYRFDHFLVPKPMINYRGRKEDHEKPLKGEAASPREPLHYGHAHAQTESL